MVNIEKIITDFGLRNVKITEDEIIASCPFSIIAHERGSDSNPSWALNFDKGVYYCFTCHAKGTFEQLTMTFLGLSYDDALEYIEGVGYDRLTVLLEEQKAEDIPETLPEGFLEFFTPVSASVEKLEGIVESVDCWIWPVRNLQGDLVGAVAKGKEKRFVKNLWHLKKRFYLLGEEIANTSMPLVIVEGPGDREAIYDSGYDNAVALMGSNPSKEQIDKILRITNQAVVWLDKDKAGFNGAKELCASLDLLMDELRFVDPSQLEKEEKDPKDVYENRGAKAIREIIDESRTLLDWKLHWELSAV